MEDHDDEMGVLMAEPARETQKQVSKKVAKTVVPRVSERRPLGGGRRAAKEAALVAKNVASTTVAPQSKRGEKSSLAVAAVEVKARRKGRPATIAERGVYFAQRETGTLLRKGPFGRLVREVAQNNPTPLLYKGEFVNPHFSHNAIAVLQIAAEDLLIHLHAQANKIADHCGRCTLYASDMKTVAAVESMKTGGVLDRTIYTELSADGLRRKIVLIGEGGVVEKHVLKAKKIM